MSNGDESTETDEAATDPDALSERLAEVEDALDAAATESDLDDVETELDEITEAIETLPESDESEDDEEPPRVRLTERADALGEDIDAQRGPYASEVTESLDAIRSQITDARWTETGEADVIGAVEAFLSAVDETLETSLSTEPASTDDAADALTDASDTIETADLDPDDDTETIETLVDATEELKEQADGAQEWSDLTVREQLDYQGFYDVLDPKNRKDFPPELNVVRIAESNGDPEPILLALETFDSDFMEDNCLDALCRMGPDAAFEEMNQRAQKRGKKSIETLGKIGDDRALETLLPYIEGETDPGLQKVTLKAIGEIGSEESTQAVADRLVAESSAVRSAAAKALGCIGDSRAIDPLTDRLEDDDDDAVRASAAWALNQIGTRNALEHAREYDDDRSYLVQIEAERATTATTDAEAASR